MTITLDLDTEDLERKLSRLGDAMDTAMANTVDSVVQRVVVEAKTTTLFQDRTGLLRKSIRATPRAGKFSGNTLAGGVVAGGGTVGYARYVHDGTQPHVIRPRNGRALRIPTGTGFVFRGAVNHPGTDPRPFLTEAIEAVTPQVPTIGEAFITRALRDSGLA